LTSFGFACLEDRGVLCIQSCSVYCQSIQSDVQQAAQTA
jgi:hypothetical protein